MSLRIVLEHAFDLKLNNSVQAHQQAKRLCAARPEFRVCSVYAWVSLRAVIALRVDFIMLFGGTYWGGMLLRPEDVAAVDTLSTWLRATGADMTHPREGASNDDIAAEDLDAVVWRHQ